jgi:hypothetical protein
MILQSIRRPQDGTFPQRKNDQKYFYSPCSCIPAGRHAIASMRKNPFVRGKWARTVRRADSQS